MSEYDYDGAQDDIQENDADNEIKHWETPVFTTNPQTLLVNEGDTIRSVLFVKGFCGTINSSTMFNMLKLLILILLVTIYKTK